MTVARVLSGRPASVEGSAKSRLVNSVRPDKDTNHERLLFSKVIDVTCPSVQLMPYQSQIELLIIHFK
jgi:hypothetical protein